MNRSGPGGNDAVLVRAGRRAWAVLGLAGVVALGYLVLSRVSLVVSPLVVALFPAAVLWPVAARLKRRGVPATATALLLLLGVLGLVALVLWFVLPRFAAQLPALADSVERAMDDLADLLEDAPVSVPFDFDGGLSGVLGEAADAVGSDGDLVGQGLDVVRQLVDAGTALVLFLVALFFYLRDGERIWSGVTSVLPASTRTHLRRMGPQLAWTLGAYFRGQMAVALVDAVAIGIGLAVLGVPLVLPLALLIFLGGFFPIVGAFVSGLVAVLVALADQGLVTALLALGVIVLVQQLEGNLLEPLILSPVLRLHPFLVIIAVTVGAITYGVLGAFLGVPLAACAGRVGDYLRGRPPAAGPGWSEEPPGEDRDGPDGGKEGGPTGPPSPDR